MTNFPFVLIVIVHDLFKGLMTCLFMAHSTIPTKKRGTVPSISEPLIYYGFDLDH